MSDTINADRTSLLRMYEGALAQREKLRADLAAATERERKLLLENALLRSRCETLEQERAELSGLYRDGKRQ